MNHFDRNVTPEPPVSGAVDRGHAAVAELLEELVLGYLRQPAPVRGGGRIHRSRFYHPRRLSVQLSAVSYQLSGHLPLKADSLQRTARHWRAPIAPDGTREMRFAQAI